MRKGTKVCGIIGIMNADRTIGNGEDAIRAIALMHERSNGLGGGFAAYGIYPDHANDYALHLMYSHRRSQEETEGLLEENCVVVAEGPIPTRPTEGIAKEPLLWRYFVRANPTRMADEGEDSEDDFILRQVMAINHGIDGAFVMSSGKNMGAFKAVGYAEDVARYYRLEEYYGYTWIGHSRFPTNTPGWWGGAHPFTLLDWSVVHNGEISSYGINRRYLEQYGYRCTLQTDTEVLAYLLDLLIRRHGTPIELACRALASPFWKNIDRLPEPERRKAFALRLTYGSALVNGPFAIVVGHRRGMIGMNDRIKLRPMVAGRKNNTLYIASEESAIREICPHPDEVWAPKAGEPVLGWLEEAAPEDQERDVIGAH